MGNDAKMVTAAKPKITGAIYRAPLGTEVPKDAKTPLNIAFKGLGYVSDEGVDNDITESKDDIKAWGGDTVLSPTKEKKDTFKFTLIEALNVEVLKAVFGKENVSGTLDDGIAIKVNSKEKESSCWAIETVLNGGVLKRIVIPLASASVGSIKYQDSKEVGYELTLTCSPDTDGDTHKEYIVKGGDE